MLLRIAQADAGKNRKFSINWKADIHLGILSQVNVVFE